MSTWNDFFSLSLQIENFTFGGWDVVAEKKVFLEFILGGGLRSGSTRVSGKKPLSFPDWEVYNFMTVIMSLCSWYLRHVAVSTPPYAMFTD
jgi:hypothetical protein